MSCPPEPLPPEAPITALARRGSDELSRFALEPTDFDTALRAATVVSKSGMFGGLTPERALVRIMTGRALGIPMLVAMVHVHDIEGKPGLSARLKCALAIRHPDCVVFEHVESDAVHATYRIQRRGQKVQTFTFTFQEAEQAGLTTRDDGTKKDKGGWFKWRRRMLQARAASEAVDVVFPEAGMGLDTYHEGETIETTGEEVIEAAPVLPPVVVTRAWATEAQALKERLQRAVLGKDAKELKAIRRDFAAFHAEAPADVGEGLQTFYVEVTSAAKKPREGYLPPEQRGDSYDGPDEPFA